MLVTYSKLENSNNSRLSHGNSIDAGYESLLSTSSSVYSYSSSMSSSSSSHFSLSSNSEPSEPTTPVKSSTATSTTAASLYLNSNNSAITPDLKKTYIADVNAIYLASIKSGTSSNNGSHHHHDSLYSSPVKSSFTFNYSSSSSSNSPIQFGKQSPKFESFITQRDNFNSKLLKSPAFKLDGRFSPYKSDTSPPTIRSFKSRFQAAPAVVSPPIRPTPTEEEFMQMLIADRHLPSNPESLIGRHMGLDKLDILSKLWDRSMNNVLDKIFGYFDMNDLVRVGHVCKNWKAIIEENPRLYRKRCKYLDNRQHLYEKFKENRMSGLNTQQDMLTLEEKRNLFKKYRAKVSLDLSRKGLDGMVFTSLDLNCLNNLTKSPTRPPQPPPPPPPPQPRTILGEQFLQATNSLNLRVEQSTTTECKKRMDSLPKFICRNFKLSPSKSTEIGNVNKMKSGDNNPSPAGAAAGNKIDLIGSRKSKKNLKRL